MPGSIRYLPNLPRWWGFSRVHRPTNMCSKGPNCGIVDEKQVVDDDKVAVSIASAEVGRIAARGIARLVRALDCDAALEVRIISANEELCRVARDICKTAIKVARDIAKDAKHRTQTDLPVSVNLTPVVTAIFDLVHKVDNNVRKDFDKYTERAKRSPYSLQLALAAEKTVSDINHAIANAIKAHIVSIAAPTTTSVPALEKLVNCLACAAVDSMRLVEYTAVLMGNMQPPLYESLESYEPHQSMSGGTRASPHKTVC